jgi:trk system potassium uptake protein TrkA
MPEDQYIIVVGCGRLGSLLANRLSSLGRSVIVVDANEAAFGKLTAEYSGFRVVGDAAELAVLRQAGIDRADCLLAVTPNDNVNLMAAQVAKTVFDVPKAIARVFDPSREPIYHQFGIETICPTTLSAGLFLDALQAGPQEGSS